MADQKSRGGQKQGNEKQPQGKKERGVKGNADKGQHTRTMKEDAQQGAAGRKGPAPKAKGGDEEE